MVYILLFNSKLVLDNTTGKPQNLSFWFDALTVQASDAPVAFVGTHVEDLDIGDIAAVEKSLTYSCKEKVLNYVGNEQEDMMFFPVENL